ncbi:hypothetical protein HOLleu_42430 [Holothuria leucospilota]|uniref:Reverse transcriptase zinc-binding domain-containing protein n=1 Tax=Holothuria leucospilota TaxID=206669 RepID=A0A9Q0YFH1_HOLLE|nr:hypothetical protein HOLleu_42430 [Holothuria leucospilota]
MASSLCKLFPLLWSNSLPNSALCSPNLSKASDLIKSLHAVDAAFVGKCTELRDIVLFLEPKEVTPTVMRKYPTLPWTNIWRGVFHRILDRKYVDFQFRLSHRVLFVGELLKKWGIGKGKCAVCGFVTESISHVFWDCRRAYNCLSWVGRIVRDVGGTRVIFNSNLFLYGSPDSCFPKAVFARLWFVFCAAKFFLWKARCKYVADGKYIPDTEIINSIKYDIKTRVEADFHRLSAEKFKKIWVQGSSFVFINNEKCLTFSTALS